MSLNGVAPWAALGALSCLLGACGADRTTPDEQGVTAEAGPCGRGLLVLESDYISSNIAAVAFDGSVLSPSLLSSRTELDGFASSLSHDVTLPTTAQSGPRVVIIDSALPGIVRFLDVQTARVTAELPVGTGFDSDPYDYLALGKHRAYVARYQSNPTPGRQEFDEGGDVLIVDPSVPSITGRIDLSSALAGAGAGFSPHPAALVRSGSRVFALLAAYADDYSSAATSRLVELDPDTDSLRSTLSLSGFFGCDGLAVSPARSQLAIICTGDDLGSQTVPKPAGSGLVLVDITSEARVERSFKAADLGGAVLNFYVDYLSPDAVLVGTFGHRADSGVVPSPDRLLRVDLQSGEFSEIEHSLDQPFTLGGVRCAAKCGACFATDAERAGGSVLRFPVDAAGTLGSPTTVRVETQIGLPPRYLGVF